MEMYFIIDDSVLIKSIHLNVLCVCVCVFPFYTVKLAEKYSETLKVLKLTLNAKILNVIRQSSAQRVYLLFQSLSSTPSKDHAKCDSWVKSLHIFIFDILFELPL